MASSKTYTSVKKGGKKGTDAKKKKTTKAQKDEYNVTFGTVVTESNLNNYSDNIVKNLRGIHGAPYQFMEEVDARPSGSKIGRKYQERIVSRMPLLLITPGEPNYLTGFSAKTQSNLIDYLKTLHIDRGQTSIKDLLSDESSATRYFTLDFAYAQYYQYVNSMLRMASRFLEIHGRTFPGKNDKEVPLWKYDWSYYTMDNLPGVLSSKEYVAFYVESEESINETISNSTTQSVLASSLESGSDTVNEIRFLLGSYGAKLNSDLDDESSNQAISNIEEKLSDGIFKNNRLLKRLVGDAKTIVAGGKIIFPELWSDSSFSKNYSVSVKLRSPDCDKFSWFINIFVPLAHLICLAAPRQAFTSGKSNPNAYYSPFIIRAFYKGLFSIEMGIIDSLSISKGAKCAWTIDGLPTEVDVEISLKDLYDNSLVINKNIGRSNWSLIKATSMTDYIATSCGININKPDVSRMVDLFIMQKYNKVTDIPRQAWLSVEQSFASGIYTFFKDGKFTT